VSALRRDPQRADAVAVGVEAAFEVAGAAWEVALEPCDDAPAMLTCVGCYSAATATSLQALAR
jgi:hypothetical protein